MDSVHVIFGVIPECAILMHADTVIGIFDRADVDGLVTQDGVYFLCVRAGS